MQYIFLTLSLLDQNLGIFQRAIKIRKAHLLFIVIDNECKPKSEDLVIKIATMLKLRKAIVEI